MCIPWGGTRTLPQGCTVVSWLLLSCLCFPSLPWLATVRICPLELREGHGGWTLLPPNKKWGTLKGFHAQEPHRVLLGFSTSMRACGLCQAQRCWLFLCLQPGLGACLLSKLGAVLLWSEEEAAFLFLHQTQHLTGDHHHLAVPPKGSQSESALSVVVTALLLRGDKLWVHRDEFGTSEWETACFLWTHPSLTAGLWAMCLV